MTQFGGDLGLSPDDIATLEPEITFITSNCNIEAIALVTETGYQIAYAALPTYTVDSDALSGIASAAMMTGRMTMMSTFNEPLSETIIRADNGYIVITSAGRFVLVGAGRDIKNLMTTVKVFHTAAQRIEINFPALLR
jgi:predicted regulator of Ras-like GTPase activity (Roadblock/LC7/MglB family)